MGEEDKGGNQSEISDGHRPDGRTFFQSTFDFIGTKWQANRTQKGDHWYKCAKPSIKSNVNWLTGFSAAKTKTTVMSPLEFTTQWELPSLKRRFKQKKAILASNKWCYYHGLLHFSRFQSSSSYVHSTIYHQMFGGGNDERLMKLQNRCRRPELCCLPFEQTERVGTCN